MGEEAKAAQIVNHTAILTQDLSTTSPRPGKAPLSLDGDVRALLAKMSPAERATLLSNCDKLYEVRRCRDAVFGDSGNIFGEAAWDILLDLYAKQLRGIDVSVGSACVAASVPITTALRWLNYLEDRRLVVRRKDHTDSRRRYVQITPDGFKKMSSIMCDVF